MAHSCVVPQHALSSTPGKRAARLAALQASEEWQRQQAEREAARRQEAERMLTVHRKQTVAGVLTEIETKYQKKLEELTDPVVARSAVYRWVKEQRDRCAGAGKALIIEAWQQFTSKNQPA